MVSETFILNQIAFFIKNGIDVEIVSVFPGEKDIQHNIINEYDLMSKTRFLLDSEPNGKFKNYSLELRELPTVWLAVTVLNALILDVMVTFPKRYCYHKLSRRKMKDRLLRTSLFLTLVQRLPYLIN